MPYFGAMSIHKSQQFWCVQLMCQWNPHFFLAKAANFMLGQSPFPLRTQLCFEWGARSSTEAHWVAMVGTTNHLEDNYYECTFIGWFGGFGSLLYFLEKMCYMRNSCQSFHYSDQNIHLLYIYTYILYIYIYICTHTHPHTHTYILTHTHAHTLYMYKFTIWHIMTYRSCLIWSLSWLSDGKLMEMMFLSRGFEAQWLHLFSWRMTLWSTRALDLPNPFGCPGMMMGGWCLQLWSDDHDLCLRGLKVRPHDSSQHHTAVYRLMRISHMSIFRQKRNSLPHPSGLSLSLPGMTSKKWVYTHIHTYIHICIYIYMHTHCILGNLNSTCIQNRCWIPLFRKEPPGASVVFPRSGVYTPTDNANQQYGANGEPLLTAVTIMGWGRSEGTPYWLAGELRFLGWVRKKHSMLWKPWAP